MSDRNTPEHIETSVNRSPHPNKLKTSRMFRRQRNEALRERDEARSQALIDELTQLPNRRAFIQEFETIKREIERERKMGGKRNTNLHLLFMDIKDFKGFNSVFTHAGGDEVLRVFGKINGKINRPREGFYRIGGDEFVQLIEGDISEEQLSEIATRNQNTYQEEAKIVINGLNPRVGNTLPVPISSSIQVGIVRYNEGIDAESLIKLGSGALLEAKTTETGVTLTIDGNNYRELGKAA